MKNLAPRLGGILTIALSLSVFTLSAQKEKKPKSQTVVIKTSSECGDCKERIESKLNYTKGVIYSELDIPTKQVTVKFKPSKISLAQVKQAISEIGYDADEVKAIAENQKKLPLCCQPGGMK